MTKIFPSREELINEINILKLQNAELIANFEDVTEFKRTEESLKQREEKLKTILENSRDSITMLDLKKGKYLYISPAIEDIIGFNENEIINFTREEIYDRVHPLDLDIFINVFELGIAGIEKNDDLEYRWKVKSGEFRWLSDRRKLVRDENGQPYALVTISRDITEQKKYEEMLGLQAGILANVNDALIVVDEKENIIYCNKAFVKLFGWQEEELIGKSISSFIQDNVDQISKEKCLLSLEQIQKVDRAVDENSFDGVICYSKNSTQKIIDINNTVVRGPKGEIKIIIFAIRDVSERYKYQLKLKKSEEKYRYLYNSIDQAFAIIDIIFDKENKPYDLRYIELNPATEKIMGIRIKDILGKTAKELKFDFEDYWYETFGKVALTGQSIRLVNEVKSLNLWLDEYVFKIDLEKDNRIGIIFSDTTEKLLHKRKMEELIEMQDELYVNVSHELKTPLNVIFSANQLIDLYLKSESIEKYKDNLIDYNKSIKQNCYRLTRLISNIVDLSKSSSGLLKINFNNENIVAVVENIVQSVSEYVKSKELKIIFDTNVEEKIIACDPYKLERVMLNLISNAMKFSNPKGEILVKVLDKVSLVEISVKDTGRGIEKQNLDNIFNRFYQEDKSLSRKSEGSGIGLSLIKSIVELHGGNISVESEVNKGSIFKVELPSRIIESKECREQINSQDNKIENIKIELSDIYSIN